MQDETTRRSGGSTTLLRLLRTKVALSPWRRQRHRRAVLRRSLAAAAVVAAAAMLWQPELHISLLAVLGSVVSGGHDGGDAMHGDGSDTENQEDPDDDYEEGHEPVALRSVGVTRRRKRVLVRGRELFLAARRELLASIEAEWNARVGREAVGEEPGPEPEPIDEHALWEQSVAEAQSLTITPRELELYWELAPGLLTEEALDDIARATGRRVSRKVLLAAVCRHPLVVGLRGYLPRRTGGRGPRPARKLVSCAFLSMAFGRGRPCLADAAEDFRGDALLAWAFGYPDDDIGPAPTPTGGEFWTAHRKMLAGAEVSIPNGIQAEAWLELARQTGVDDNGRVVPLYPRAGETLVVDYSFVEADVEQVPTREHDSVLQRLINGAGRQMVRYCTYASDGRFRRKNRGYKGGVLLCPDTMASPKFDLKHGAVYEPEDAIRMLEELFEQAPDFPPVKYLVGDRLYQHDRDVMRTLLWRMGIIPKFAPRGDDPEMKSEPIDWDKLQKSWDDGAERPASLTWRGVPHCTTCKAPMRLDGWADKFWSQEARLASMRKRARGNLESGEKAYERVEWVDREAQRARLRFVCDGCNARAHVRPDDDPRVFSPLPWVGPEPNSLKGESDAVARGRVLLMRRNAVESWLAALQRLGIAGKGMERPAWARDHDMTWLLELGAAFLTLRKLVLVNGSYEFALGQARALGLLKPMTRHSPGLAVDADALLRAERAWDEQVGEPRMPRRWSDLYGADVYEVPYGDPHEEEWDDPLDAAVRGEVEHNDAVAAGEGSVLTGSRGGMSSDEARIVGRPRLKRRVRRVESPAPRTLDKLLSDDVERPLPDC